jgi:hypothetical protein
MYRWKHISKNWKKQATTYVNKDAEMVKQVEYYSGKIIQR